MKPLRIVRVALFGLFTLCTLQPVAAGQSAPTKQPARIFQLHTDDFWLNLHQFLYVLGRAEAKMPDMTRRAVAGAPADQNAGLAQLAPEDQRAWRDAVRYYSDGPSRQDAVFDDRLVKIGRVLADAADAPSLSSAGLDASLKAALERAAPIYRKAWWPSHHAANEKWIAGTQALVDEHGRSILTFVTRVYGLSWPADGFPVHLSGYANWAGAFSTSANLLVMSSLDSGNAGTSALETIFHEAMHQWDDPISAKLLEIATADRTSVPPDLTHALIWMTVGEAVRRAIPGHVPYADANGLWRRSIGVLKPALESVWRPYLNGEGTRDAAFRELLRLAGSKKNLYPSSLPSAAYPRGKPPRTCRATTRRTANRTAQKPISNQTERTKFRRTVTALKAHDPADEACDRLSGASEYARTKPTLLHA